MAGRCSGIPLVNNKKITETLIIYSLRLLYSDEITTPQDSTLIGTTVSLINKFLSEPMVR
jgi:hypothetical protein